MTKFRKAKVDCAVKGNRVVKFVNDRVVLWCANGDCKCNSRCCKHDKFMIGLKRF